MSIFSRIFAKPEDASKIIDGAVAGIDKLFFTKEEKADANQKISDWYIKYLAATEGQNLARRFIALLVVGLWTSLVLFGVAVRYLSVDYSNFVFDVLTDVVMQPFSIIIAFFFLAHTVRAYNNGKQ